MLEIPFCESCFFQKLASATAGVLKNFLPIMQTNGFQMFDIVCGVATSVIMLNFKVNPVEQFLGMVSVFLG